MSYGLPVNYALKFNGEGILSFGRFKELDNLDLFTIQFWMNPSEWVKGSYIFSKGESFKLTLGNENELILHISNQDILLGSKALVPNVWTHITIMNGNGQLKFLIDNVEKKVVNIKAALPAEEQPLYVGVNYKGRFDELRIWHCLLVDEYENFWRNTLNEYNPNWNDLIAYYKFDQFTCQNIVDYKGNHHGTVSINGVTREQVTDNFQFRYMIAASYINFDRLGKGKVDKDHFYLTNNLNILSGKTDANGHAWIDYPFVNATFENTEYTAQLGERKGLAHFKGEGAKMNCGTIPMATGKITISSWLYIDEWKEGVVIIKKYLSDTKHLVIKLGPADKKQLIVSIHGNVYTVDSKLEVKKWNFFGMSVAATADSALHQVKFVINDWKDYATSGPSGAAIASLVDYTGMESVQTIVGENFNGYMDDTTLLQDTYDFTKISNMRNGMQMPEFEKEIPYPIMKGYDCWWRYDKPNDLGYDWFSWVEFMLKIVEPYEGRRGYRICLSFMGHDNWIKTLADPVKCERLASEIAEITNTNQYLSGCDLDLEWPYSTEEWQTYGNFIKTLKPKLNKDKILTVTPHVYLYQFPKDVLDYIDLILMQCYGPNSIELYRTQPYINFYNRVLDYGYRKDNLCMSYGTTTTYGFKDGQHKPEYPGENSLKALMADNFTRDTEQTNQGGYDFYFSSYNDVYFRSKYMRDTGAAGIMYWDTITDVLIRHPLSQAKASSFAINGNVDIIVDKVDNAPPVPYPARTPEPTTRPTASPVPAPTDIPVPTATAEQPVNPDNSKQRTVILAVGISVSALLVIVLIVIILCFMRKKDNQSFISQEIPDSKQSLLN